MSSASKRPRVTVDTNVFVSGSIVRGGTPFQLLEAWRHGMFTLVISEAQRSELSDVLGRPPIVERLRVTGQRAEELLRLIDKRARRISSQRQLPLVVRDPKDEPILAAALGGQADYLVTGDKDLLVLAGDPRLGTLRIVTAADFLAAIAVPAEP